MVTGEIRDPTGAAPADTQQPGVGMGTGSKTMEGGVVRGHLAGPLLTQISYRVPMDDQDTRGTLASQGGR